MRRVLITQHRNYPEVFAQCCRCHLFPILLPVSPSAVTIITASTARWGQRPNTRVRDSGPAMADGNSVMHALSC